MWKTSDWKAANCPVCRTELGYRRLGEIATYLCDECNYWFTWDLKGKLLKPQTNHKSETNACDCGSCKYRESQKKH